MSEKSKRTYTIEIIDPDKIELPAKYLDLRRKRLNAAGAGYGRCGICGDSWLWKKGHAIPLAPRRGAIPYCEECAEKRTIKEKLAALASLASDWKKQGAPVPEENLETARRHIYEVG